jgi:hypothetical protein
MKEIWIKDGTAWMRVMDRHDQLLLMLIVPRPMKAQTVGIR